MATLTCSNCKKSFDHNKRGRRPSQCPDCKAPKKESDAPEEKPLSKEERQRRAAAIAREEKSRKSREKAKLEKTRSLLAEHVKANLPEKVKPQRIVILQYEGDWYAEVWGKSGADIYAIRDQEDVLENG